MTSGERMIMKGQIKFEFIFGVLFFAVILFFLASQLITVITVAIQDSKIDSMKAEANIILTILVEDAGEPKDWESGYGYPAIKRVGLASAPYNLSKNKIKVLGLNCNLLEKTGLLGYRLVIRSESDTLLFCGYTSINPLTIIVQKPVMIEKEFGNISLEIW